MLEEGGEEEEDGEQHEETTIVGIRLLRNLTNGRQETENRADDDDDDDNDDDDDANEESRVLRNLQERQRKEQLGAQKPISQKRSSVSSFIAVITLSLGHSFIPGRVVLLDSLSGKERRKSRYSMKNGSAFTHG